MRIQGLAANGNCFGKGTGLDNCLPTEPASVAEGSSVVPRLPLAIVYEEHSFLIVLKLRVFPGLQAY
jgi:hypothetical protein